MTGRWMLPLIGVLSVLLGAWLLSSTLFQESTLRLEIQKLEFRGIEGESLPIPRNEIDSVQERAFTLVVERNRVAAQYEFFSTIVAWLSFGLMGCVTIMTALTKRNGPNPTPSPAPDLAAASPKAPNPVHGGAANSTTVADPDGLAAQREDRGAATRSRFGVVVPIIAALATISAGLSERLNDLVESMDQKTVSFRSEIEASLREIPKVPEQEARFILKELEAQMARLR